MATELRRRRGSALQHETFTGAQGEITIDLTNNAPVVHDGVTAGGFRATMRNEIVGEVSQSGGVPTGAIIESGSNANGSWDKFASGLMICNAFFDPGTFNVDGPIGSLFSSLTFNASFPVTFVENPSLGYGTVINNSGVFVSVTVIAASTTGFRLRIIHTTELLDRSENFGVIAIGRWFNA